MKIKGKTKGDALRESLLKLNKKQLVDKHLELIKVLNDVIISTVSEVLNIPKNIKNDKH